MCASPTLNQGPLTFAGYALEVTMNGQFNAFTRAEIDFVYYDRVSHVRVSHLYPQAGAVVGGTIVSIWGHGFHDLDHGEGLMCVFDEVPVAATRQHGHGHGDVEWLKCLTPPLSHVAEQGSCPQSRGGLYPTVEVRITLNGDTSAASKALTADTVLYTYYNV